MDDVAIGKAAHDVGDRIDLADVAEKLVAEALAAGGAAHQPGDVDEFELGRDDLCRFRQARTDREPLVGHRDPPDIGLDRAERVIRRLGRFGRGQGVEERGLADIGQADDAAAETHRPQGRGGAAAAASGADGAKRRATSLMNASGVPLSSNGAVSATASIKGATHSPISSAGKFCST